MTDIKDDVSVDGEITTTGDVTDGAGNVLSVIATKINMLVIGSVFSIVEVD